MIQFFRKIRRRFSDNRQLRKYLLYAIGEILLVVIGILIALQVNNLNEASKERQNELAYLQRIRIDIAQDIGELEGHFLRDTMKLDAYTYLGRALLEERSYLDYSVFLENMQKASRIHWFEGKNTVFEEMKASGKLSLISSDTLREQIQVYYRLFDEVIKQEALHNGGILQNSEELLSRVNISPLIELGFPKRWQAGALDSASMGRFFENLSTITDEGRRMSRQNYSAIKRDLLLNNDIRLDLYQQGIALQRMLTDFTASN